MNIPDATWKNLLKAVMAIAIPVALQNLLSTTGSMVDTIMISSLSEQSIGAVGLCGQFSSLMFSCYWGFVGGGMLFISQYWGAKDDEGINRSYGMTLACMMFVGLTFAVLGIFFPELIMSLYTDKPAIQEIGIKYLRIVAFGYPLQVMSTVMALLLRATDRVRIPLIGAIVSVCTNMLMNYLLIFGKLGLPEMGVEGAALGTACSYFLNFAIVMILAKRSGHKYLTAFRAHFRWDFKSLKLYFAKCFPILCNEFAIGIGNMIINIVLGHQSEPAIAATAVLRTFEGMIIGFFAGFSSASGVIVGSDVGSGRIEAAYRKTKKIIFMTVCFIFIVGVILISLHYPLLTLMSLEGESYSIAYGMLVIFCTVAVVRMGNWCMNDTFRSAGDTIFGTVLEITFMFAVLVPAVWVSGMVLELPFHVIFVCCYIDEPIRFVMMLIHMHRGKFIKPVTPQGIEALSEWKKARGNN